MKKTKQQNKTRKKNKTRKHFRKISYYFIFVCIIVFAYQPNNVKRKLKRTSIDYNQLVSSLAGKFKV